MHEPQWLSDDVSDGQPRVERARWVLKDDRHVPAVWTQLPAGEVRDIGIGESDRPTGRLQQPDDAAPHRGLPGAALTDQSDHRALADPQGHPVDRPDRTEVHDEVFYLQSEGAHRTSTDSLTGFQHATRW